MKYLILLLLFLPSVCYGKTLYEVAKSTSAKSLKYYKQNKSALVIEDKIITLKMVKKLSDAEITVKKDEKFGYILEEIIYSKKVGIRAIKKAIYVDFIRDGKLVGRWFRGYEVIISTP